MQRANKQRNRIPELWKHPEECHENGTKFAPLQQARGK